MKSPPARSPRCRSFLHLAVLAFLAASPPVHASDGLVLQGEVCFEDLGRFLELPFHVPEGTTLIRVSYSFAETGDRAGGAAAMLEPVLDIGLYDPGCFRGWSGSSRSSFTVSESRERTTDGYVPGEIPAGEWFVELGVAFLLPGTVLAYTVEVSLEDVPVGDPFVPPARADVEIPPEQRWYRGDLHCHSTQSDGGYPMAEVFGYAESVGLDFLALTDHNTSSHWLYLGEHQALHPELLLLYGVELTSYRGHANVFNIDRPVDYHGTETGYDVNEVFREIHDLGGYVSPNHPSQPVVPVGDSFVGWGWGYPETDWTLVDFYEVVNGPARVGEGVPNLLNSLAVRQWEDLLDQGYRITAVGGSDDHQAGRGGGPTYAPIGVPTTVVYSQGLSPGALFQGLRAGRAYITEGPRGPWIRFTAHTPEADAMLGDTIAGDRIRFRVEIAGGEGRRLFFHRDGHIWASMGHVDIDADPFVYEFEYRPLRPGRVRLELMDGPFLCALTNPIYVDPATPGWQAASLPSSTLASASVAGSARAGALLIVLPLLAPLALRRCLGRLAVAAPGARGSEPRRHDPG